MIMNEINDAQKIIISTIIFLILLFSASAQNFHLSQYDASPLSLNPALTGMRPDGNWIYRANINYRSQWQKLLLDKPYQNVAFGFDMPINKKFAVGIVIADNKSAGGSFNTLNTMLSGSYKIIHKNEDNPHNLSVGLQIGFFQKSFNPRNFVYDSQYSPTDPNAFDQHLPSGELFAQQNFFGFDANMGIYYRFFNKDKKNSPFAGFSVYHLNRSNESFTGGISKTPMQYALNAGWYYKINDEFTILRQLLYMNQANANELNFGIFVFYKIKGTDYQPMLGVSARNKDAVIIHLGLKQKFGIFRISYDINTSYLEQYSNGRGACEVSFIYTGQTQTVAAPKFTPAPVGVKGEL